ncbi:MAG: hypothetical protein WCK01_01840 [Candidatus Uhrbacteria bacterium]
MKHVHLHFEKVIKNPRMLLMVVVGVVLVLVAFGGIAASGYVYHVEKPPIASMIGWMPAARVGSQTVTYAEYLKHVEAQRTFIEGPASQAQGVTSTFGDPERSAALERAIRIAAIDDLAFKAGMQVTQLDVERAYLGLVDRAGTSTTPQEIRDFLHDQFGMDEVAFKEMVVRPALLEDTLRAKSSQESGDAQAFDKTLEERLKQSDVVRYVKFKSLANEPAS